MRLRSLILISVICFIAPPSIMAQGTGRTMNAVGIRWNGFTCKSYGTYPGHFALEPVVPNTSVGHDLPFIPSPYSYHALGLFCKAEVKLNSLLPFPVMVRLGDVRRAEELDGKGDPLSRP